MIAAEDLMIGNWVNAEIGSSKNPKKSFTYITAIYVSTPFPSKISYICSYGRTIDLSKLEPIPLTPDVLERLGFVDGWLKLGFNDIIFYNDHFGVKGMMGVVKFTDVKYVHTLQNICKVFGKDLKLKTT